jgi:hypothetical protein
MSKQELEVSNGLSGIMTTEANIAMPEIVAIFLSKYESDLYTRKAELNGIINDIENEGKAHDRLVAVSISFKEYAGLEIKKLHLITRIAEQSTINWNDGTVTNQVCLTSTEAKHDGRTFMDRPVHKNISKADIKLHKQHLKDLGDRRAQYSEIIQCITDMNRKEREIKGQISAMRLKDAGMDKFVNDPALLELIKVV